MIKKRVFIMMLSIIMSLLLVGALGIGLASAATTVTWTSWANPEEVSIYNQMIAEFEKDNPTLKIDWIHVPYGQYFTKLLTMIAGGKPPDAAFLNFNEAPTYAEKNILVNLDPLMERDNYDVSDVIPGLINGYRFKGKLYSMPLNTTGFMMVYNKDLFDAEGLAYPNETWTWDDLRENAIKLTKDIDGDGKIDQYALNTEPQVWHPFPDKWFVWVWMNGGRVMNEDKTRCVINNPQAVEALQYLYDNYFKYHLGIPPDPGSREAFGFAAGKLATSHPWWAGAALVLEKIKEADLFDWGLTVVPHPKGKKAVMEGRSTLAGIPVGAKNKDGGWELIKWIAGPRGQEITIQTKFSMPMRTTTPIPTGPVYDTFKLYTEALAKYGRAPIVMTNYAKMVKIIKEELDRLWLEKQSVKEALANMETRVNEMLGES